MNNAPDNTLRHTHDAMACTFGFTLSGAERSYLVQAARAAAAEIDRLESLLSRYRPDSDIGRLNATTPGEPVRVSPETLACLQLADELFVQTGGAFDIAFGSDALPPDAPRLIGNPEQLAVTTAADGVIVDLGGLGKGYALDRALDILAEWRIPAAIVDSGQSTVRTLGDAPQPDAWRVAIRDPADTTRALGHIALAGCALSGSGQALHGGHIRDPRDKSAASRWSGTWALAPTAAEADALSTALMLLDRQEATDLCRAAPGRSAILLPTDDAPQFIDVAEADWQPARE